MALQVLCADGPAEWRQQSEDQRKRTEQHILDTSAREAELLLRNRELSQQVSLQLSQGYQTTVTIVPYGHLGNFIYLACDSTLLFNLLHHSHPCALTSCGKLHTPSL